VLANADIGEPIPGGLNTACVFCSKNTISIPF